MLENISVCPICRNNSFSNHLSCKDHFLTQESFNIVKCDKCSFLFVNPRPGEKFLGSYYQSEEYISHTSKANNLINSIYKIARTYTLSRKVSMINKLNTEKSVLDFGCGTGDFLSVCNQKGWKIHGFEPDKNARDIASSNNQIEIFSSADQLKNIKSIGIITLWHVLEHVSDLNETLSKLTSILDDNGKMVIAVPNYQSYDSKHYETYWAAYDVPRHLYHFSQSTMKLILENHGLKINQVLPMKLDSFYVSLLSEKYKNGKLNYFKSFINGYKSNTYAKKYNNDYSSLIYIASK